jgi:hypothetical protein
MGMIRKSFVFIGIKNASLLPYTHIIIMDMGKGEKNGIGAHVLTTKEYCSYLRIYETDVFQIY